MSRYGLLRPMLTHVLLFKEIRSFCCVKLKMSNIKFMQIFNYSKSLWLHTIRHFANEIIKFLLEWNEYTYSWIFSFQPDSVHFKIKILIYKPILVLIVHMIYQKLMKLWFFGYMIRPSDLRIQNEIITMDILHT
jgi:hypothetical protein